MISRKRNPLQPTITLNTSGMLSIVGERESAHAKLEARMALRYEQCGLHIYIYIYI